MSRDLRTLPKGHLHLHLEGAMRPSTLRELSDRDGLTVPETRGFGSFTAFADMYVGAMRVLRTADDLARLTREVVDDAADDGAVWLEPALYPAGRYDHLGGDEAALEIVLAAGTEQAVARGIGFGVVLAADRTVDPAEAVEMARLASTYAGNGVVGFGLANDEAGFPPEPFAAAFAIARDAGLLSVPHAGELDGPSSVRGALDALRADRIMHGVRCVEDPSLVERLADEGVCLDVCPSSNLLLAVVPSLVEHPLPHLLASGVRCSLNADDPLLFGPGLLDEYVLARRQLGLDDELLAECATSSLECSGAPDDVKVAGVAGVKAWLG